MRRTPSRLYLLRGACSTNFAEKCSSPGATLAVWSPRWSSLPGWARGCGPSRRSVPKPLVPVGDRPALAHVLERVAAAGLGRVVVNAHHGLDKLEQFLAGYPSVALSREPELLGTAGGVAAAEALLGDGRRACLERRHSRDGGPCGARRGPRRGPGARRDPRRPEARTWFRKRRPRRRRPRRPASSRSGGRRGQRRRVPRHPRARRGAPSDPPEARVPGRRHVHPGDAEAERGSRRSSGRRRSSTSGASRATSRPTSRG